MRPAAPAGTTTLPTALSTQAASPAVASTEPATARPTARRTLRRLTGPESLRPAPTRDTLRDLCPVHPDSGSVRAPPQRRYCGNGT